jgi:hypothetical protein
VGNADIYRYMRINDYGTVVEGLDDRRCANALK